MFLTNGKMKFGLPGRSPLAGRFLAADFDSSQLRLTQVAMGISGPGPRKMKSVDIPSDVDTKNPQQMGEFLAQALRTEGFSKLPLVMNVPRSQAVLKPLQLPPGTERDEVAGMVKFQVQGDIPFAPEETVLDFSIEGEFQNGAGQAGLNVLAAAIQTSTVEFYQNLAASAGLKLSRLGLRPYSNANCAEGCDALEQGKTTAVVQVTADETEINILEGNNLVFSRSAAVKITQHALEDSHARWECVDGVVGEIIRTLQGYAAMEPDGSVDKIFIAGGTGIEADAVEILSQVKKFACTIFDPADSGKLRKKIHNASAFIATVGMAFGTRSDRKVPIDFLHPKQPVIKRDPKLARRNALALTGLLIMTIFIAGSWLYLDGKASEVARLRREKKSGEEKQKALKRLIVRVDQIDTWDAGRIDWLDQWANLSSVMPEAKEIYIDDLKTAKPNKTLTEVTSTGKTVQRKPKGAFAFTVRAHDDEDIAKLVAKLQGAGYTPETTKDSEDLRNPFGYIRNATMTIYIPADMQIDVSSLKKKSRPKNDDLKTPLTEAKTSAGDAK